MGVRLVRLFISLLIAPSSLRAHRLPLKTYTTADGLARDRIECIVQDRRGFIWICTSEGLSRFDGYGFTNYGTTEGLPSNVLTDLLETGEGIYWIGTSAGLCRFKPAAKGAARFVQYNLPGDKLANVNILKEDRQGAVWCGTNRGLFRLPKGGTAFERVEMGMSVEASGGVHALMADRRGALWVGTGIGLYVRQEDGAVKSYGHIFRQVILALLEDREGRLWVGTDGSLWRIEHAGKATRLLTDIWVFSLLQTSDGKIWLGTNRGLAEWVPQIGRDKEDFEFYGTANGLSGREISSLMEDRDGNVWMGSDGGGVMRMAHGGFITYHTQDGLGDPASVSGTVFDTREGRCFARGSVISRFDGRHFHSKRLVIPRDISYFSWAEGRMAFQDRAGEWWLGTAQGLCRFPAVAFDRLANTPPRAVYRMRDGLPADLIFQLFEDSRGDIWVGTMGAAGGGTPGGRDGLALWERKSGRIRVIAELNSAPTGFAEDRAGNIWIGIFNGMLARFGGGRLTDFTNLPGVPGGSWKVPFVDSAGRLWIVSRRGLGRANDPTEDRPHFVTYTTAQGLVSNHIKAITEDGWGRIYVASGRGLDRLEPQADSIRITKHYTYPDGLVMGELSAAYRDRTGDLWFASNLGISQLTPAAERAQGVPPMLLTGLAVGTAPYVVSDIGQSQIEGIRVRPGQGPLRIDFVGLSFAPGEKLRYQYRLDGVDQWSAPAEQRSVVYGRLAAGTYRFLVRAVTSEGGTTEPATVTFTVLPPVWLTWWFLTLAATAAGALVYILHRYRVQQLLAVERVRTRIATDLHDDIGSSLSQISILSELARYRLDTGDPKAAQPLGEIATVSREMVAALSDIVWAINPKHDHLSDLAARMRRFAVDVLGTRGIDLRFEADCEEQQRTSSDFRRQLYLIFKEAVNNAARHSACTQARVEMHICKGRLELCISDNGRGFELSTAGKGNGLVNMQRRAAGLGGTIELHSEPGQGASLKLTVPLQGSRHS
jgi:ligand-binding sensor domain-containing protein/two-component sensor histidine kinase